MQHLTKPNKTKDVVRAWHHIDATGKVLGRCATVIAKLLIGKNKPYYSAHLDCGDYVVVTNSSNITVTGNKRTTKMYAHYSGFPGGLHKESFAALQQRRPTAAMRHAIYGMLPKNKLRDRMIKRLYIYADDKHPYGNKFPKE